MTILHHVLMAELGMVPKWRADMVFCGSPKSITAICGWVKFLHLKLQFLGLEKISPDHLGMVWFFLEMNEAMIMNHEAMRHPKYFCSWFHPWNLPNLEVRIMVYPTNFFCSINMALWSANKKGDGSKPWRKPMIPSDNTRFSGPCLPRNIRIMRSWEAWNSDLDGPFSKRTGCEAMQGSLKSLTLC